MKDQRQHQADREVTFPVQRHDRDGLDDEGAPDREVLANQTRMQTEAFGQRNIQRHRTADARIEEVGVDLVENAVEIHHRQQGARHDSHVLINIRAHLRRAAITQQRMYTDDQNAGIHECGDQLVVAGDGHRDRITRQHHCGEQEQQLSPAGTPNQQQRDRQGTPRHRTQQQPVAKHQHVAIAGQAENGGCRPDRRKSDQAVRGNSFASLAGRSAATIASGRGSNDPPEHSCLSPIYLRAHPCGVLGRVCQLPPVHATRGR